MVILINDITCLETYSVKHPGWRKFTFGLGHVRDVVFGAPLEQLFQQKQQREGNKQQ